MKLKNIVIVVRDIRASIKFYNELFGLEVVFDGNTNVILTEGLVLQERKIWEETIGDSIIFNSKCFELYFEERNIDRFIDRLERFYPDICYINDIIVYSNGKKVVRFYDLDGHIIEVATMLIN